MNVFGWGKIKSELVTELFGDDDAIAKQVPLVAPPVEPPALLGAPPITVSDIDAATRPLRLPAIEMASYLGQLPALPIRDWRPRQTDSGSADNGDEGADYVAIAGVNVPEALELAERVGDAIGRAGRGAT